MNSSDSLRERFEEKYEPVTESGCWIWTGALTSQGYGKLGNWRYGDWETAHRLSYQMFHGEIPEGMFVCHRCDVKTCVNPKHLFLGSHQDNMKDARKKGRRMGFFKGNTYGRLSRLGK